MDVVELRTVGNRMRSSFVGLVTLACVLGCGFVSHAAFPQFIMFYGKQWTRPILVTEPPEIENLMAPVAQRLPVTLEDLRDRPYIEFALFWGLPWKQDIDRGDSLADVRPEDVDRDSEWEYTPHHGRFYPPSGPDDALVYIQKFGIGIATKDTLRVLAKHGVIAPRR